MKHKTSALLVLLIFIVINILNFLFSILILVSFCNFLYSDITILLFLCH